MNLVYRKGRCVAIGSRIHLTLTNTTTDLDRVFGGLGLYIREPSLRVCVEPADQWEFDDTLLSIISKRSLRDLFDVPVRLTINPAARFHVGLGASTQVLLAIALLAQGSTQRQMSIEDLARKARRGGASGVGVELFAQGGILFDLGRARDKQESRLSLSDTSNVRYQRRPIIRRDFPEWTVVVGMPLTQKRIFGETEETLFDKFGAVQVDESRKVAWHTLFEVIPGVVSGDFDLFCNGIENLRRTGFKAREISVWGDVIERSIKDFEGVGLRGITMSSWGPTIVGFSLEKPETLARQLQFISGHFEFLISTKAQNNGAKHLNSDVDSDSSM